MVVLTLIYKIYSFQYISCASFSAWLLVSSLFQVFTCRKDISFGCIYFQNIDDSVNTRRFTLLFSTRKRVFKTLELIPSNKNLELARHLHVFKVVPRAYAEGAQCVKDVLKINRITLCFVCFCCYCNLVACFLYL